MKKLHWWVESSAFSGQIWTSSSSFTFQERDLKLVLEQTSHSPWTELAWHVWRVFVKHIEDELCDLKLRPRVETLQLHVSSAPHWEQKPLGCHRLNLHIQSLGLKNKVKMQPSEVHFHFKDLWKHVGRFEDGSYTARGVSSSDTCTLHTFSVNSPDTPPSCCTSTGTHLRDESQTLQHRIPSKQKYAHTCRFTKLLWYWTAHTLSDVCVRYKYICFFLIKCKRCSYEIYIFKRLCTSQFRNKEKKNFI